MVSDLAKLPINLLPSLATNARLAPKDILRVDPALNLHKLLVNITPEEVLPVVMENNGLGQQVSLFVTGSGKMVSLLLR